MRIVAIVVALALGGGASGCAFLVSKSPGPVRLPDPPSCRASKGAVVVDGVVGGFMGLSALAAVSDDAGEVGAVFGLISALYVASAVSGNSSANRCAAANEEFNLLAAEHNAALEARELQARRDAQRDATSPSETRPRVTPPPGTVVDPWAGKKPPAIGATVKPAPTLSMRPPEPVVTPVGPPPRPVTPTATVAPRPPAVDPTDDGEDDGGSDDGGEAGDAGDDPDDDDDDVPSPGVGRWRDFWREVTP